MYGGRRETRAYGGDLKEGFNGAASCLLIVRVKCSSCVLFFLSTSLAPCFSLPAASFLLFLFLFFLPFLISQALFLCLPSFLSLPLYLCLLLHSSLLYRLASLFSRCFPCSAIVSFSFSSHLLSVCHIYAFSLLSYLRFSFFVILLFYFSFPLLLHSLSFLCLPSPLSYVILDPFNTALVISARTRSNLMTDVFNDLSWIY